jgi:hypothetical protein
MPCVINYHGWDNSRETAANLGRSYGCLAAIAPRPGLVLLTAGVTFLALVTQEASTATRLSKYIVDDCGFRESSILQRLGRTAYELDNGKEMAKAFIILKLPLCFLPAYRIDGCGDPR